MAQPAATVPDDSAIQPETPKKELGPVFKIASGPTKWLDDRIGLAGLSRPFFRKVFPDHWSFLLGEIALYSFIVLILSGIFLTIWFKPSMSEVEYQGSVHVLPYQYAQVDVRRLRLFQSWPMRSRLFYESLKMAF